MSVFRATGTRHSKQLLIFPLNHYRVLYLKKYFLVHANKVFDFRLYLLRNSYNPARWFKQIKRTLSSDVTTRFNPNQQSIGYTILTSTVVTQRSSRDTEIFLLSLRKAVFLH